MPSKKASFPLDEARLSKAVEAFKSGVYGSSMLKCHIGEQVPYDSFRRRLLSLTKPHSIAHDNQRILSRAKEDAVLQWMKYNAATRHATSLSVLRVTLQRLGNLERPVSKMYVNRLLKRRPDIVFKKSVALDPKRATSFNRPAVEGYFEMLRAFMEEKGIKWENVWNMDEKGIQLGGGRKNNGRKYFWSREQKARYRLKSDDLELVTVIDVCNAEGRYMTPGFVASGKHHCPGWYDGGDDNILVATSENGWTSDFICTEWFQNIFIPQALALSNGEPVMLIYDGHGSHTNQKLREIAFESNVHLFKFPSHTTHKLQPLDVGVFGPIQRRWQEKCDEEVERTGSSIHISDVVRVYMDVRREVMTPDLVKKAWRKSGLNPLNPNIFTDYDYAPSKLTSSLSHLPTAFGRSAIQYALGPGPSQSSNNTPPAETDAERSEL